MATLVLALASSGENGWRAAVKPQPILHTDVDRDYSHTFNVKSTIFLALYGFTCGIKIGSDGLSSFCPTGCCRMIIYHKSAQLQIRWRGGGALKYLSWLCIRGCTPFTKQTDKGVGSLLCMRGGAIGGSIVFARHFVLREQNLKIDSSISIIPQCCHFSVFHVGAASPDASIICNHPASGVTRCTVKAFFCKTKIWKVVCGAFRCRQTSAWVPSNRLCREWPSPFTEMLWKLSNVIETKLSTTCSW